MKKVNLSKIALITVSALVIYFVLLFVLVRLEAGHPSATIRDFGDSFWWSVVTVTSVGYGDMVPVTYAGKVIGFIFLFGSFTLYAILIGQIASVMNNIRENNRLGQYGTNLKDHAVMIGWNSFGKTVTDQLTGAGKHVAIITREKTDIDFIRENYDTHMVYALYTDYSTIEHLQKAKIQDASIVFVNLEDDTEKLVYILNLKKTFSGLKYIVSLDNSDLKQTFVAAGVTYALSKNEIASKLLASYMFEPDVAIFNEEIIAVAETDELYDIKQYQVLNSNPYIGMMYEKVFYDIKRACNAVLVGIVKCENDSRKLYKNPEGDIQVTEDDYLLLLVNGLGEKKLTKLFRTTEGYVGD